MTMPRALRLDASDNVIIAIDEIAAGAAPAAGVSARERIPKGHKMAVAAVDDGRAHPQVRANHRFRLAPNRRRRVGSRAQLRREGLRARLSFRRGRASRDDRAGRGSADLSRVSAAERQGRHAQLSRHPDFGELLCDRRAADRAGGRTLRDSGRLSPCRRRHSAGARHWLRHRRQGRGIRRLDANAMGLRRQIPISARL